MSGTQVSHPVQVKRVCRFYNEGVCSHESSHGNNKCICTFCEKQGRTATYPENMCPNKLNSKDKHASTRKGCDRPPGQLSLTDDQQTELCKGGGIMTVIFVLTECQRQLWIVYKMNCIYSENCCHVTHTSNVVNLGLGNQFIGIDMADPDNRM